MPLIKDDQAPRAAVILCLRGTDPFLKDCIAGLLNQDYPNYQVRIIVDSPDDPAHAVVAQILSQSAETQMAEIERKATHVRVENLQEKSSTCSLKCSSLRQVVRTLDPQCGIVAQLDADTTPHSTWLRELATALQPSDVGAATGNRWYMPKTLSVGSLVRYTWNAAAIVQMYWYRVAWGGTLAIKSHVIRESDLLDKWGLAFCEDTMLHAQLRKSGLRVAFVPSLMMINRENTSLGGFFRWVSRQLMTAKLYHPAWPAVMLHGIVSTLAPLAAAIMLIVGIVNQNSVVTIMACSAIGIYAASLVLALLPMEHAVRQIVASRGENANWLRATDVVKCAVVMPITQVVYPAALVAATFAKSTTWRGIHYTIDGPWQIRMKEYLPYRATVVVSTDDSL